MIVLQFALGGPAVRPRPAAGAVDLVGLTAAMDERLLNSLPFAIRRPGDPGIPSRHSYRLAVRREDGTEWQWVESRHNYDLPAAGTPEGLERLTDDLSASWVAAGGEPAHRKLGTKDGRMSMEVVFELRPPGSAIGSALLPVSRIVINQALAETVSDGPATAVPSVPRPAITPKPPVEKPPRPRRPRIAIVIDDVGDAPPVEAELFWKLKGALTYAVLPYRQYTREQADRARALGHEVILHLPMEPLGSEDPGTGAILTTLSDQEVVERVRDALAAVPGVIGVNNHMGSRATADPRIMRLVLDELQKRELFFLDSMSGADSLGAVTARSMGLPTAKRQVFLDNVTTVEAVSAQLKLLVRKAKQFGSAIGIGHLNRPATAKALAFFLPQLESLGVELVPLSLLVR